MLNLRWLFLAGAVGIVPAMVCAAQLPSKELPPPRELPPARVLVPYQIVLRSRNAVSNPTKTKDAQVGGGAIRVDQPEPNTLVVWMTGTAVAGSEVHGSSAGITFELEQALEILPTRGGLRPPRIGMVGFVEGTLQVTDPYKHPKHKNGGSAEQSPATACLAFGDAPVLSIAVRPFAVGPGSPLFVNNREGPVEVVGAPGCYKLQASFGMAVSQGKYMCIRQYAVADFDPAPQLDASWADALKPFRAIVRKNFGFRVIVRVVEDLSVPLK